LQKLNEITSQRMKNIRRNIIFGCPKEIATNLAYFTWSLNQISNYFRSWNNFTFP